MAESERKYININGIDKRFVHQRAGSNNQPFWSIGIQVPYEYSRNGIVNVTSNYEPKETKNDPNKVNVGWPEGWEFRNVRICTFHDSNDSTKDRFEEKTITIEELNEQSIAFRKAMKERAAAAETPAQEEEQAGPEM